MKIVEEEEEANHYQHEIYSMFLFFSPSFLCFFQLGLFLFIVGKDVFFSSLCFAIFIFYFNLAFLLFLWMLSLSKIHLYRWYVSKEGKRGNKKNSKGRISIHFFFFFRRLHIVYINKIIVLHSKKKKRTRARIQTYPEQKWKSATRTMDKIIIEKKRKLRKRKETKYKVILSVQR